MARLTGVTLRVTERGPVAPLGGWRKKPVANPGSPYAVPCHLRGLQLTLKPPTPNRTTASRCRGTSGPTEPSAHEHASRRWAPNDHALKWEGSNRFNLRHAGLARQSRDLL